DNEPDADNEPDVDSALDTTGEIEGAEPPRRTVADPLRVCFVTSEVAPFAKTGGLADVSAALPAALGRRGHDVRIFMPLYASIDFGEREVVPVDFLHHVPVRLGSHVFHFSVFTTKLSASSDVDVYFIGCPALYDRHGVYTGEWDEHLRYALLARAALECCQRMGWSPDVVHAHDWHAALLPIYLRTLYSWDHQRFGGTKTVLTIHNIAYQGMFPAEVLGNLGLADVQHLLFQDDLARGAINFLKTGLLYADVVTTVSRTYAREIQTPEFGQGLDALLRERRASVVGIVNGIDSEVWSPRNDPHLARPYGIDDVEEGKAANRAHLLREMGLLGAGPEVPVFGVVSRLTSQKGLELTFEAMPEALRYLDIRFVVLGSGEAHLEEHFTWLQRTFPRKMCFYRGYSEALAHLIEAGVDIFLMPSRFEPCGLNQMYSLAYGTAPIVRRTGGLADTVVPFDRRTRRGTGFVFEHHDRRGFSWVLKQALAAWRDRSAWAALRRNAMRQDFSWERQVLDYERLYRHLRARS
ncbi:MAG: glycogen synthase GlgA, partial [Acidobacteriota bacterium]